MVIPIYTLKVYKGKVKGRRSIVISHYLIICKTCAWKMKIFIHTNANQVEILGKRKSNLFLPV